MSRVPTSVVDPGNPRSIVEHLANVQRVVDGSIEFGSPQDPNDPASLTLANGTAHNGTLLNIQGSWVEVDVTALDTPVACRHNLEIPFVVIGGISQPNVRWQLFGFQHSGNGVGVGSTISCNYETTDENSISEISFPLRFYATARVVGAAPDHLRVTLFFTPAVR